MTSQLTIEDKFVPRTRSTMLTSLPTFRFDSSTKRERNDELQLPITTTHGTNSKNFPKHWEILCLFRTVMYNEM